MKQFSAQTGGRYTYVDDIINLQELALAFGSIFTECDNFIVSGCEISGTSISSGIVYINGKLRSFAGATGLTSFPRYLCESNSVENVAYASGTDKVGRTNYGCVISASVPANLDPVTGTVPGYIQLSATGGLRMKDALFGKYSLLLNAASGSQSVAGTVNFQNAVNVSGIFSVNNMVKVVSGTSVGQMSWDDDKFIIQARVGTGSVHKFVVDEDGGYKFYVDDDLILTVGADGILTDSAIASSISIAGGNIKMSGNAIYNYGVNSDSGVLEINMAGYNGGQTCFRNTKIGNGKGTAIIDITGSSASVLIQGQTTISSDAQNGLVLKSTLAKTNSALRKTISFQDANAEEIASLGFIANNKFLIKNYLADIEITGSAAVNIGPAIKENGTLLSTKYVLATTYSSGMSAKANSSDVYSKTVADEKFGTLAGGLSQFIVGANTKAVLRSQIDAMGSSDVSSLCPTKANLLADMATTEAKKAQIRANIGAASANEQYEPIVSDSGWKTVIAGKLYVRQIGKIVCIQGEVTTIHSGTVFTLPNSIGAPAHDVAFYADTSGIAVWSAKIAGGSKSCTVMRCGNHGETIPFSMTYMTA